MIHVKILVDVLGDDHGFHAEKDSFLAAVPRIGETVVFDLIDEPCSILPMKVEEVQWEENGPAWLHMEGYEERGDMEASAEEFRKFGWYASNLFTLSGANNNG